MEKVLFVCIHNSARSQMAEAFVNSLCGDRLRAESAGFEPRTLNPLAVEAMREVGIDISSNATKSVFDLEACPIFPGLVTRVHWSFADPSTFTGTPEERLARTRAARDEIRVTVQQWCDEIAGVRSEPCGVGAVAVTATG